MKQLILSLGFLALIVTANAQGFYATLGGGPSFAVVKSELSKDALKGSYGEGMQAQMRLGYMITEKFGLDLGFGYLQGKEQKIKDADGVQVFGKSRAFGAALSAIYYFSNSFYARGGFLTKLGGKTLVDAKVRKKIPLKLLNPLAPANLTTDLAIDAKRENSGSFPAGFTLAAGYKYNFTDNIGFFAEIEYQGINVPASKSKLTSSNINLLGSKTNQELIKTYASLPDAAKAQFAPLVALVADEVTYVDKPDAAKFQAESFNAPYSSLGIVFGIMFMF